jgi:hypothetical protein
MTFILFLFIDSAMLAVAQTIYRRMIEWGGVAKDDVVA